MNPQKPTSAMQLPGYLERPTCAAQDSLHDLALDLYQRVADGAGRLRKSARQQQDRLDELSRETDKVIAALAAVRFEFERVISRLRTDAGDEKESELKRALGLLARQWDATLRACSVEVRDLAGQIVDDQLAEAIEVRDSIPDPQVAQLTVRATLAPAVYYRGRLVGLAVIVTSAPVIRKDAGEP